MPTDSFLGSHQSTRGVPQSPAARRQRYAADLEGEPLYQRWVVAPRGRARRWKTSHWDEDVTREGVDCPAAGG